MALCIWIFTYCPPDWGKKITAKLSSSSLAFLTMKTSGNSPTLEMENSRLRNARKGKTMKNLKTFTLGSTLVFFFSLPLFSSPFHSQPSAHTHASTASQNIALASALWTLKTSHQTSPTLGFLKTTFLSWNPYMGKPNKVHLWFMNLFYYLKAIGLWLWPTLILV